MARIPGATARARALSCLQVMPHAIRVLLVVLWMLILVPSGEANAQQAEPDFPAYDDGIFAPARYVDPNGEPYQYVADGDLPHVLDVAIRQYCEKLYVWPGDPRPTCAPGLITRKEIFGKNIVTSYRVLDVPVLIDREGEPTETAKPDFGIVIVQSCPSGAIVTPERTGYFENRDPRSGEEPVTCSTPALPLTEKQLGLPEAETNTANTCPLDESPMVGNPINALTGSKIEVVTDFESTGAPDLTFRRYYSSGVALVESYYPLSMQRHPELAHLGARWRHSFDRQIVSRRIYRGRSYTTALHLVREDGKEIRYVKVDDGYQADADEAGSLVVGDHDATYTAADGSIEHYNGEGRLDSRTDLNGNVTRLVYAESRLAAVTDPSGRSLHFDYDSDDRIRQMTLPNGGVVAYDYEDGIAGGREADLVGATYPDGRTERYHYDEAERTDRPDHRLTGIDGGDGRRFATFTYSYGTIRSDHGNGLEWTEAQRWQFDKTAVVTNSANLDVWMSYAASQGAPRITKRKDFGGETTLFTRNDSGQVESRVNDAGMTIAYEYDPVRNLEIRRVEAKGTPLERTVTTQWHSSLRLPIRIEDPNHWTSFIYDAKGNLLEEREGGRADANDPASPTWPDERAVRYAYDGAGRVTSIDGPREDVDDSTKFSYFTDDAPLCVSAPTTCAWRKGDLRAVTNALGHATTTLAYDGAGRVMAQTDANGVRTERIYDGKGRPTSVIVREKADGTPSAMDAITAIAYDANGQVKEQIDADGVKLTYEYDPAHRLVATVDAVGNRHDLILDGQGLPSGETYKDAAGTTQRTIKRYFNDGRLSATEDSRGEKTYFSYNEQGQLKQTQFYYIQENLEYDLLGRHVVTDFHRGEAITRKAYDGLDEVRSVTDPKGLSTGYLRNGLGDRLWQSSPDTAQSTFVHDAAGQVTETTSAAKRSKLTSYDALGRPTVVRFGDGSEHTHTYDTAAASCPRGQHYSVGRLSRLTDASGYTEYCYDFHGHVVKKTQQTGATSLQVNYSQTPSGRVASVTYPDGMVATYRRDSAGNTVSVDLDTPGRGRTSVTDIQWTADGLLAGWRAGDRILARSYDLDGRPIQIKDVGVDGLYVDYTFEDRGLIETLISPEGKSNYIYDSAGRLTSVGGRNSFRYSYDNVGNRIGDREGRAYVYQENTHHLTKVGKASRTYDADGNTLTLDNRKLVYDAEGRLMQSKVIGIVEMNYRHNGLGERVERFIAGQRAVSLYDEDGHWIGDYAADGKPIRQIVWLEDWPVALVKDGKLYDIQPDHLGTPRVLVDRDADTVVWTWSMLGEPFGAHKPNEDPDKDGRKFVFDMRFPGQRYDATTGLHYNYRRDYDPGTGRFVQSDPSGLEAGISTYAYANGNPLLLFDRMGYAATDAPGTFESLIPVWGSGRQAVNDWSEGNYLSSAFNAGMAATDLVPGKALAVAACKGAAKFAVAGIKFGKIANQVRPIFKIDKSMVSATKIHRNKYFGKFYQIAEDGLWWTKDKTGHGGSAWKVYKEESGGYRWIKDVDQHGNEIPGKHKGPTNLFIPKADLN